MDRIWWGQVSNAARFVSNITDALLDEKSILIRHASGMPWEDTFTLTVQDHVKEQNSEKRFDTLPASDQPGEYLLNEYCKKEKRALYRPSIGYAAFLAESDDIVLHDRYLWIRISDQDVLLKWMEFASEYLRLRGDGTRAVFIFDVQYDGNIPLRKGIKEFDFDDYIGEYDRVVFSVLISSGISDNAFIKTYLAELVSNVAGNDMELSAACIERHSDFLASPFERIQTICSESSRSDGTTFVFTKTEDDVEHLIWLSQIRTLYPYIEEFREEFVKKHEAAIRKQLPISGSYGEIFEDPKDVELGTLKYMVDNNLFSLNVAEYERLAKFKEARNKLSHLSFLRIEDILNII